MSSQASSIPSSLCPTKIEVLITVTVTHAFYKMETDRQSIFDACVVTEYSTQKLQYTEVHLPVFLPEGSHDRGDGEAT